MRTSRRGLVFALIVLLASVPTLALSQTPSGSTLDKLVAPIALYPDPLVAQILPASTYPVQVIEADRALAATLGCVRTKGTGPVRRTP